MTPPVGASRALSVARQRDAIPDSGISRWTFDDADTDSGTAKDVWGDNDGTIYGGITTGQTGKFEEAYYYDGSDDTRVDDTGLKITDGQSFTAVLWYNPETDNGERQTLINQGDLWWINNQYGNDNVTFNVKDSGGNAQNITKSGAVSAGGWHLFGISHDGNGAITGRIDDSFKDTMSVSAPLDKSSGYDVQIGGLKGTSPDIPQGRIDNPSVYDKVLTDDDWSNLYSTGSING